MFANKTANRMGVLVSVLCERIRAVGAGGILRGELSILVVYLRNRIYGMLTLIKRGVPHYIETFNLA